VEYDGSYPPPASAAPFTARDIARLDEERRQESAKLDLADLGDYVEARSLREEIAALRQERDRLRREIGVLERQKADWQLDNPHRPYHVDPGGYGVTHPEVASGRDLQGWPSCDPGEVPVYPLLWPEVQEGLARWRLWARDHPDRAAKSLAAMDPQELRAAREALRQSLAEMNAAWKDDKKSGPR
jgi:hypothetical protein